MSEEIKNLIKRARHNAIVYTKRAERDDFLEADSWRRIAKTFTELADALEASAQRKRNN